MAQKVFVNFYSPSFHELGRSIVAIETEIADAEANAGERFNTRRQRCGRAPFSVCRILESRDTRSRL